MTELLDALLQAMLRLPPGVVYLVLGLAATVENVFPPIPADTVVLFGGFLTARSAGSVWLAFFATWFGNVAGALLVYGLGRAYGARFFGTALGRLLLQRRQLEQLEGFYRRYGVGVIFVSRFFPVFRSVVPAFAGMSRVGPVRTAVPLALASGIWYGLLVYLGATAGRNWESIQASLAAGGRWLAIAAALLAGLFVRWWWKSRREEAP